jgi:nicotinic acid phosphoribosyltransferase
MGGPLGRLTGVGGFRSLLSRALALSGEEISWLRALHINEDGSLEGLEKLEVKPDTREIAEGEVVLVSQLLGLLVTFIGPALTAGLLHDIWPKMDDLDI